MARPSGRSASDDNTLRLWDPEAGVSGWRAMHLPDSELATFDASGQVTAATAGAWRYFAWRVTDPETGAVRILPAEAFGPLPLMAPETA